MSDIYLVYLYFLSIYSEFQKSFGLTDTALQIWINLKHSFTPDPRTC